jgi:hypothetical protein
MGERSDSPVVAGVLGAIVALAVALGSIYWVAEDPGPTSHPSPVRPAAPTDGPDPDQVVVIPDVAEQVDLALPPVRDNLIREAGTLVRGDSQGYGAGTEKGVRYVLETVCANNGPVPASLDLAYDVSAAAAQRHDVTCDGTVHAFSLIGTGVTSLSLRTSADEPVAFVVRLTPV